MADILGPSGQCIWRMKTMAKRSQNWSEGLSEDLKDPAFARDFILAAVDEGLSLQYKMAVASRMELEYMAFNVL